MPPEVPLYPTEILIVDGYRESREIFKELLELSGYQVRTATDGAEAFALMTERLAPIVIIDENLHAFRGDTLSAHLKETAVTFWQGARCITISIDGISPFRTAYSNTAYDHVLKKPMDYERLDSLLARCSAEVQRSSRPRVE